jgi:DNA (cytosine-5)-methyltransferase 1
MVSFGEYVDDGTASAMKARDYKDATDLVAQTYSMITANTGSNGLGVSVEVAPTLDLAQPAAVAQSMVVRRLTPTECERLQGFPDNYTNIPGASDTTRYKALGNSMAVPVMAWIGKRIKEI